LQPAVSGSDTMFVFKPTTARVSGHIIAAHATAPNASTGLITVNPGAPVGTIILHPDPKLIAAHPDSFSIITSDVIFDFDGNAISEGDLFTVSTTLGTVTTPDEAPGIAGNQIKSNTESKITFQINAGTEGGTAFIYANSIGQGSAVGDTTLIISNLRIVSVNTDYDHASQGQLDLPVRMVVENVGSENISITSTDLKFTGPAPNYANVTGEYTVTRTDGTTQILANTQVTLTFLADVAVNATTGIITIDGYITGEVGGLTVSDYSASQVDEILIQSPPVLIIEKVEAFADTVIRGTNTTVTMTIRNDGDASVVIDSDSLTFWAENLGLNETQNYGLVPYLSNPDTIIGHSSEMFFNYTVGVGTNASLDTVTLDGKIEGHDVNSNTVVSDLASDVVDGWWVKQGSDVEITEFTATQSTVTNGQEEDWYLNMAVTNNGGADLKLDSVVVEFSLGGENISDEYLLIRPSIFQISGDDTLNAGDSDTLKITVDETGTTLGTITITGTVYLNDMISGQIIKSSATGVMVQSQAHLTIDYIRTSQPEVTTGQTNPWNIVLSLTNNDGGDIAVDSTQVSNFISFDGHTDFSVVPPSGFYGNNNFILKSGKTDSLFFIVDATGNVAGDRKVRANISAIEINSQRVITVSDSVMIKVESPANIRIKSVNNIAPNTPYVDTGQEYQIRVVAENIGEDAAKDIEISLSSDSASTILNPVGNISTIKGGETDTVIFNIQAFSSRIVEERFTAKIDTAVAENTPEPDKILIAPSVDSLATAIVQRPSEMIMIAVIPSQDTVKALSTEKWEIVVAVRNDGEGTLTLDQPLNSDISFSIEGDFLISAPDGFTNSPDLSLSAGEDDTLIYEINRNGQRGGPAYVRANLSGIYLNKNEPFQVVDSSEVYIRSSAVVYVDVTEPVCPNIDQYGTGQVNEGQNFTVRANIKNSGAEIVDDVVVHLTATGYAIVPTTIDSIDPSGSSFAMFNVTAQDTSSQVDFIASIASAIARQSGLPAAIGASSDSIASVRVHKPAELKWNIDRTDTLFTAAQIGQFKLSVSNSGTAEVDTGRLSVKMPAGYSIVKGEAYVSIDTTGFIIGQQLSWQILPPAVASSNDKIITEVISPPKDKNTDLIALIPNPFDTLTVSTIPSLISVESFEIISPGGATDDTLSTEQSFYVEVQVDPSENLDSVKATIILPGGFGFGIGQDSTKLIPGSTNTQSWELQAANSATTVPGWLKVIVSGKTDGVTESVRDSFSVVVQARAELEFNDISTSSENDSIFSTGQEFDLNVKVESRDANQAMVEGVAELIIDLGSTGITLIDEPSIKDFKVDSVVTWRLKAPDAEFEKSPITIFMESIPYDVNTNEPADIYKDKTRIDFQVETVLSANITVSNLRIISPYGATDKIISSYQEFTINAFVSWDNCINIPLVTLQLPAGFTTPESNPKNPSDTGQQQGSVSWRIQARETAVQDQNIWLLLSAYDANTGSMFSVASDSIEVDVVNRAVIQIDAQIVSPASALDGIVSVGDEFVVSANLTSTGDANLVGNYSATLELPSGQGYSTSQSLTLSAGHDESVNWTIQAPFSEREPANIRIHLASKPQDENTNAEIAPDAVSLGIASFPITTEQKSVTISTILLGERTTVARGDTSVSMMGLDLSVSGDAFSNNVLFKSVKVKLKNRSGALIENPRSAITRLIVAKHQENSVVYGQVVNIPSSNPIEITFTTDDTLKADFLNQVVFKADIASDASVSDFLLAIDSSQAFQMVVEGSGRIPNIKDETGETTDVLNITSEPLVLIEADFNKAFGNYPNPFGNPDRPETKFVYYLDQDSDVRIQIYTLIGELVWQSQQYSINENSKQCTKGTHDGDIVWDGRNGRGHKVLNGVYIARISTNNKKDTITKVAIIK